MKDGEIIFRTAVCRCQRITEQTALLAGVLMGYRGVQRDTLRAWIAETMRGPLSCLGIPADAVLDGFGFASNLRRGDDPPAVTLVTTPLDGALSTRQGRTGTMTSILVIDRGKDAVEWPDQADAARHNQFLVAVFPRRVIDIAPDIVEPYRQQRLQIDLSRTALLRYEYTQLPIGRLLQRAEQAHVEPPIVGLTFEDSHFRDFVPDFERRERRRCLDGSAVASAIGALIDKVTGSVLIARRPHVIQIAAATRALGGEMFAVPFIQESRRVNGSDKRLPLNMNRIKFADPAPVLTSQDFIAPGTRATLVTTSVTEICFMDRVRFEPGMRASVSSLIVTDAPNPILHTVSRIDLQVEKIIDENGEARPAIDLVQAMRRRMGPDDPEDVAT